MEQISSSQLNIKTVEIKEGENKYKCQIQIIKNFIQVSLYIDNILKSQGNIHISKIQYQIYALADYTINEIFEEINILNNDNFNIIKDNNNKYKLKIKFIILRKNKYLYIDLIENEQNINNNDLINTITELKEIIKNKDQKIKLLEDELNKYKSINNNNNDNTYNNFNIIFKKPIHILNYHKKKITCSTVLKDGRFATGSDDGSIIIYNNQTFEPDIIIRDHFGEVYCILQLSSGILASCSKDKTIKLFSINKYEYNVIQTIKIIKDFGGGYYERYYIVKEIIELKNKNLIFYSPGEIYFFYKDNNEYKIDYSFAIYICANVFKSIIQTKDNEICYNDKKNLCFYDIIQRKIITKIDDIATIDEKIITKICTKIGVFANKDKKNQCLMCAENAEDKIDYAAHLDSLIMMTKDLLLVAVKNKLKIINVKLYNLIRIIDVPGSGTINCICMLNDNMLLTADLYGRIIQWKIEGDNLKLFSRKELAHEDSINTLLKIGNGLILSGGNDVRIW